MTDSPQHAKIKTIVENFTRQLWQDMTWRLGQMIPGADGKVILTGEQFADPLRYMLEPQEWLTMAEYGAGLTEGDPLEILEICQSLAEWLFSIPGESAYEIPAIWYTTELGSLWAAAFIRCQGDELITIAEAAQLAGVTVQAIAARLDRGTLKAYINPLADERQGRRLVRKSDIQ